jgi:hypothetical protein
MPNKAKPTRRFLKRIIRLWRNAKRSPYTYTATHRIVNIEQNEKGDYQITIQLIGKNFLQTVSPEALLADDKMVNRFSPTDIRTLTYLGYLDINSPKYKILAKRLSENHDQMLFALSKKGEKDFKVVTADEISKNNDIIKGLSQSEAHMVGMTSAEEQATLLKKEKDRLKLQKHKS